MQKNHIAREVQARAGRVGEQNSAGPGKDTANILYVQTAERAMRVEARSSVS